MRVMANKCQINLGIGCRGGNGLTLTHQVCYHNVHICKPEYIASELGNLQSYIDHAHSTLPVGSGVQYRTLNRCIFV